MNNWISVKDKLPISDETVIIFSSTHSEVWIGNFDGEWNIEEVGIVYDITHWMPLPKPPQT